jgi:murein DD-endopeptidase MepM/ murein hydrolase activator NlpD
MFDKNYYDKYPITSNFAVDRSDMYKKYCDNGKHEGIDYGSKRKTLLNIVNLINGVVVSRNNNGPYGKTVRLMHNTKYVNGKEYRFYSAYCHLKEIDDDITKGFCASGTLLGIMGKTGNSFGIHLHLMFYQERVKPGHQTRFLKDILKVLDLKLTDEVAFWQFGKLFFNPTVIMQYFESEQSK